MIIISDSSTLIGFDKINRLDILQSFHREIIIPKAVYDEIIKKASQDLKNANWLKIESCPNLEQVNKFKQKYNLHQGESEAIVLAKERKADFIIIDESKGRKAALENNLKIIGLLGILIKLKENGYIERVKPIIEEIKNKTDFRLSRFIISETLKIVKERE